MKAEWTNADALTSSETTGKSILILDTPKECDGCPCLNRKLWECQADIKRRSSDERPSWCPLKPMPNRIDWLENGYNGDWIMFSTGWNACLKEITDESNISD